MVELDRLEEYREQVALSGSGHGRVHQWRGGHGKDDARAGVLPSPQGPGGQSARSQPLHAPRPFGPFIDPAESSEGELGAIIDEGAKPQAVASALLRELQENATPSLVVLEDAARAWCALDPAEASGQRAT